MNEEEPFLSRWSRLKRGETAAKPEVAQTAEPQPPEPDPAHGIEHAQEPLDLTKLPRLEDIAADTDIRAFLDPRVPGGVRNEALRRAWRLDPVIDSFIEVAENQYDWNTPGGAPGYGPLDAGPDLPKLLAQATGKLFEAPRHEAEATNALNERPAASPAIAAPSEPEVATALQQAAEPAPVRSASADDGSTPAVAALSDAREPARRRHGAALPR